MDPVIGINQPSAGLGASGGATVTTAAQSLGSLGPDAFLNLMVAQLRYQDPLAPSDANAMMAQTSMLAQTELLTKVATAQQQLLGLQRAEVAHGLVGTQVEGVAADGSDVKGVVSAVRFAASGPLLVVDGAELALEDTYQFGATASSVTPTDPAAPAAPPTSAAGITDPVDNPLVDEDTTAP